MNNRTRSLWLVALALLGGMVWNSAQLYAQQPASPATQPSSSQPSAQQAQPGQAADQATQPPDQTTQPGDAAGKPVAGSQSSENQVFTGTIVKSGDKYVLQDVGGKTYDIDQQDLAKTHEGRKVQITGTLDPDGKTIHIK